LFGLAVRRVVAEGEAPVFEFEDGSTMVILNRCSTTAPCLERFAGQVAANVKITKNTIELGFSNESELIVGIAENDYFGPEALLVVKPTKESWFGDGEIELAGF
jgi:hypothetical protein